ncbi:unnamed protein product [Symbiodinium necroappetens]|uniref:Uncharacterized protein n=1 Tax=Symbiodinium necroappetens TaxID=1628268 RepID=A0A812VKR3_9DINO|nr:unnamed protein product [Symbiodinium necroappetens]
MQDAEAEMGLLQAWGTEPTKMQSEALSSKRREMELDQTGEQGGKGEKDKDPAKWRRPASKGGAQSSNAPHPRRRFQPKRSSEKSLEGLCWMMGKILLQHEGQMGIERSEHILIMLFSRDGTDGTVHHTVPAEELGLSLRACLFSTLLEELLLSQDASDALVCEVRDHWETWPLDLAVPSCAFACDLNRFSLRDHFPIKDERILQEGYVYFYQRYASAIAASRWGIRARRC